MEASSGSDTDEKEDEEGEEEEEEEAASRDEGESGDDEAEAGDEAGGGGGDDDDDDNGEEVEEEEEVQVVGEDNDVIIIDGTDDEGAAAAPKKKPAPRRPPPPPAATAPAHSRGRGRPRAPPSSAPAPPQRPACITTLGSFLGRWPTCCARFVEVKGLQKEGFQHGWFPAVTLCPPYHGRKGELVQLAEHTTLNDETGGALIERIPVRQLRYFTLASTTPPTPPTPPQQQPPLAGAAADAAAGDALLPPPPPPPLDTISLPLPPGGSWAPPFRAGEAFTLKPGRAVDVFEDDVWLEATLHAPGGGGRGAAEGAASAPPRPLTVVTAADPTEKRAVARRWDGDGACAGEARAAHSWPPVEGDLRPGLELVDCEAGERRCA